ERRRRECLLAELDADLSLVLVIELLPGAVAIGRVEDDIRRPALDARHRFQPNVEILRVVASPVKTRRAADPFVLAAAPELGLVRAELEARDLVGVDVAQQPFVRVEAVVSLLENRDGLIDVPGILDRLANPRRFRLTVDVETRLGNGRL